MTKRAMLLPVIGLGAIGMLAIAARAQDEHEEEVTLDQVPAAVKATILKEAAGSKITEVERETKNGKTVYEAEFLRDGQEIEIKVAPDGSLLEREVEQEGDDEDDISLEQVPQGARAALLELAGGAKIVKVEREREHGVLVYEGEWVVNGVKHEAEVAADGSLIETEETVRVEDLPPAVRAVVAKRFPPTAKLEVEMKMIVVYEIETRIDGRETEIIVFPTGRVHEDHDDDEDEDNHHDHGEGE